MIPILCLVGSYLLGGIPFGVLVARAKGVDLTKEGSGNIGATNVGRVIGKQAYFLVLFLDVLKGVVPGVFVPMLVGSVWGLAANEFGLVCATAAVAGHLASPYLRFKGGKGIATGLGLLLGSAPMVAGVVLVVWGLTFAVTRIVSLTSLVAVVAMVISGFVFYGSSWIYLGVFTVIAVFIFIKHIPNIKRLMKGEEQQFSFKKDSEADEMAGGPG